MGIVGDPYHKAVQLLGSLESPLTVSINHHILLGASRLLKKHMTQAENPPKKKVTFSDVLVMMGKKVWVYTFLCFPNNAVEG